jgi:hypothetical protein
MVSPEPELQNLSEKNETEKSIQLLPPRLSAVLMHVNSQNRLRSLAGQTRCRF